MSEGDFLKLLVEGGDEIGGVEAMRAWVRSLRGLLEGDESGSRSSEDGKSSVEVEGGLVRLALPAELHHLAPRFSSAMPSFAVDERCAICRGFRASSFNSEKHSA